MQTNTLPILFLSHTATDAPFFEYLLNSYHQEKKYHLITLSSVTEIDNYLAARPLALFINDMSNAETTTTTWIQELQETGLIYSLPTVLLTETENQALIIKAMEEKIGHYLSKRTASAETLHFALNQARERITSYQKNLQATESHKKQKILIASEFRDALTNAISLAREKNRSVGLLLIEIIQDKTPANLQNDNILNFIETLIRKGDNISQLTTNQFAILLTDISKFADAQTVAARILLSIDEPLALQETESVPSQVKIGIACFPLDGTSSEQLLKNAEKALKLAQKEAGSNMQNSTQIAEKNRLSSLTILNNLQHALERNEFYLRYQPIFDLSTQTMLGVEVLLRWDHPVLGSIAPSEFIPYAEKSGLIIPIGHWAMHKAAEQFQLWKKQDIHLQRLYFNISALQLKEPDFVSELTRILQSTGMKAHHLTLEISDIALMHNLGIAKDHLQYLQALGVQIAIDDFGGGFSSLSYFEALPVNVIKIDRNFVNGIPHQAEDIAVVNSVITLSKNFAVTVIAEGIENTEQLNFLKNHDCPLGQGFLLCRPLLAQDFVQYYQSNKAGTL